MTGFCISKPKPVSTTGSKTTAGSPDSIRAGALLINTLLTSPLWSVISGVPFTTRGTDGSGVRSRSRRIVIHDVCVVGVDVGVAVGVSVGVEVGVSVGVTVGVVVGEDVGVTVGVLVGVDVGVTVGVTVGVRVGVRVGVTVGVLVGV